MTDKDSMDKLNKIIDRYTEGNYLIGKTAKEEMAKDILALFSVVEQSEQLPNDEEVKAYIDTLPYYGTCTTEYNEGFEDGVKWLKQQLKT